MAILWRVKDFQNREFEKRVVLVSFTSNGPTEGLKDQDSNISLKHMIPGYNGFLPERKGITTPSLYVIRPYAYCKPK